MSNLDPTVAPLDPQAKSLWGAFVERVKVVNNTRAAEDAIGLTNRQAELAFLSTLDTAEGRKACQDAKNEDARLRNIMQQRNQADGALLRQLYVHSVDLKNLAPNQMPAYAFTSDINFGRATAASTGTSQYPTTNGLITNRTTGPVANAVVAALLAAQVAIPHVTRNRTTTMAQVADDDIIVKYPKTTGMFYVMHCELCDRSFDNAHGLYCHFSQSDQNHLGLIANNKSFAGAVDVGGIRVIDANEQSVEEHNGPARKLMMGTPGKDGI